MSYTADAYNNQLSELKSLERAIQADLKELKINSGNSVNTFNTENSCRKNLTNYLNKVNILKEDYEKNVKEIKFFLVDSTLKNSSVKQDVVSSLIFLIGFLT